MHPHPSYSRYANCSVAQNVPLEASGQPSTAAAAASVGNDDENSQAEGLNEGPGGNNGNQAHGNNVHYENIYESIEQFAPMNGGAAGGNVVAPVGVPAVSNQQQMSAASNQPQPGPSGLSGQTHRPINGAGSAGGSNGGGAMPPPPPSMLHSMQQLYHPMAYRNELYDRTAGYDVPRGRTYQSQPIASGARYANLHLDLNRPPRYPTGSLNPQQQQQRTPRKRSFDDTESAYQYYRCQNLPNGSAKYDNLYERVREEPAYQNTGSFAQAASSAPNRSGLFGRFDVIGHGVGRIERHLSSSCGNIDHYSLGGHYAVLGHSHLGTMGHIRLSQSNGTAGAGGSTANGGNGNPYASAPNQPNHGVSKDSSSAVNVKSFFSCLGGENSQSMNNLNKPGSSSTNGSTSGSSMSNGNGSGEGTGATGSGQGSSIIGGLASAAAVGSSGASSNGAISKSTGTIPKISKKLKQSQQQQCNESMAGPPSAGPVGPLAPAGDIAASGELGPCGSRVTKPSLQWLLVNKWLPLWVGQTPPDYKFIDFNFMFSRNCDGCASAGGSHAQQELVRYGTLEQQADYIPPAREYPTMTGSYPRVLRNTPQLARLREHEYENVPLNDSPSTMAGSSTGAAGRSASLRTASSLATARPVHSDSAGRVGSLRRAEDKRAPVTAAGGDPFRTWSFNFENNTFRPARNTLPTGGSAAVAAFGKSRDVRRITDGTFTARDLQPDGEKPGPSGLQFGAAGKPVSRETPKQTDTSDGRLSSASTSSDSDNFAIESLAVESVADGQTVVLEPEEDSSRSGDFRPSEDSPGEEEEGAVGGVESKGKERGSSASNDSLESLTYEPEPAEAADRSLSEDELDGAARVEGSSPAGGGDAAKPQAEQEEKLSE
ncbi:ring canal kelch homolog [Anopheles ziemanni]|nr:ring canal kelch homolog [Anopheles ziemanni]